MPGVPGDPTADLLLVYVVNQYVVPPDQPGGSRHLDLGRHLAERGHSVCLVASDLGVSTRTYARRRRPSDLRRIREDVGPVQVTWLPAGSYSGNDWRRVASMTGFSLGVLTHLLRARVRRGATVFVGSSPHLFAALATWAAARLRRVPFVFEVRDLWPESYIGIRGRDGGIQVRVMRAVADHLYARADRIVALAEPVREELVGRGLAPDRIVTIPNGVDLSREDASDAATPLGTPGRFTFVYAGAHGAANGLDTVVRACRLLVDRGREDLAVALVGDGTEKAALRELADELATTNLTFRDSVPHQEIRGLLATADAGLMVLAPVALFAYGVSPNKLFEYLGADLRIVNNVPGHVARIVAEADAGLTAAAGDPGALADAMEQLAAVVGAEPHRFRSGRDYVARTHDRSLLAGRLADVLQQAIVR